MMGHKISLKKFKTEIISSIFSNYNGKKLEISNIQFSSVQSLSCVQLFATPCTAERQASLSITNSQSLLKLMSIESVIPFNHLILFLVRILNKITIGVVKANNLALFLTLVISFINMMIIKFRRYSFHTVFISFQ